MPKVEQLWKFDFNGVGQKVIGPAAGLFFFEKKPILCFKPEVLYWTIAKEFKGKREQTSLLSIYTPP